MADKKQIKMPETPFISMGGGEKGQFSKNRSSIVLVLIALFIVAGAVVYYAKLGKKASQQEASPTPEIQIAPGVPGVSPPVLPKVTAPQQGQSLRAFFTQASPNNFKEIFLENVPQAAADSFATFSSSTGGEEKINAARSFYIILSNPGADRSDPQFEKFLLDVRKQLEDSLGSPLF